MLLMVENHLQWLLPIVTNTDYSQNGKIKILQYCQHYENNRAITYGSEVVCISCHVLQSDNVWILRIIFSGQSRTMNILLNNKVNVRLCTSILILSTSRINTSQRAWRSLEKVLVKCNPKADLKIFPF